MKYSGNYEYDTIHSMSHFEWERCYNGDICLPSAGLKDLLGGPETVHGAFDCSHNYLTSLKGCPRKIYGQFICSGNKLTSLEHIPDEIHGPVYFSDNKIEVLDFLPSKINGTLYFSRTPVKSGFIKLLKVDGLQSIFSTGETYTPELCSVKKIINYTLRNRQGSICTGKEILRCKIEFIRHGLHQYM